MSKNAGHITIEGRNMVHDAIVSGQKISEVVLSSSATNDSKVKEIERLANARNIPVRTVDLREFEKMTESRNPQGVMGIMETPEIISLEGLLKEKRNINLLLLNHIDYEQNLGAIMRTAWAAGVDAVVVSPSGVHEITPVVAKVSVGGVAYVPLISMSLFQAIKLLHKYAVPVIGVEVEMGRPHYETKLTGPTALLMGGEAEGISVPMQKDCDFFTHIPMIHGVASLNVSVATAIVLFEKVRQESVTDR